MKARYVAVNEEGRRIGETHHRAKYSQEIIDAMRELKEDWMLTYDQIVEHFKGAIPRRTIEKVCQYKVRAQTPERYKRVFCEEKHDQARAVC